MSQPHTELPAPMPKRSRRWLWWSVILLAIAILISVPIGYYLYMRNDLNRQLQAVIEELDHNDPGWRLHEIEAARPPLADEENAALVVMAAHGKIPKGWDGFRLFDEDNDYPQRLPPIQLNAQQIDELRKELGKAKAAVLEARKLKSYQNGRFKIDWSADYLYTPLDDFHHARYVAALLELDALLLAQEKKIEEAWQSCHASYRAGTAIGNPDNLIILLVRTAIRAIAIGSMERVLAQGEVSEEALKQTQKMLEDDLQEPILYIAMRGDRAGFHQHLVALERGEVSLESFTGAKKKMMPAVGPKEPPPSMGIAALWIIPRIKAGHIYYLKYVTKAVEFSKLPPSEKLQHFDELDQEYRQGRATGSVPVAATLYIPGLVKVAQADVRMHSQLECTICALAAERYRLEYDRWPDSLDALFLEGYIQKVPLDPYDGQPLRYRQTKNGIIVYSVGLDKDNKGDSLDNLGLQEPRLRIEFRVWNPDRRRQPPRQPRED